MFNIYPQRATNPNHLDKEINIKYHKTNLKNIEKILKNKSYDIWAAWGTIIEKRKYLFDCLMDIKNVADKYFVKWYTIGQKSKKGHPHHPLYLKKNLKLQKFNIEKYIDSNVVLK